MGFSLEIFAKDILKNDFPWNSQCKCHQLVDVGNETWNGAGENSEGTGRRKAK